MSEQRLSIRLQKYWEKLAKATPPPAFTNIKQSAISDVWDQCAVLEVDIESRDTKRPRYRIDHLGREAKTILPMLESGQYFTIPSLDRQSKILLHHSELAASSEPQTIVNSGNMLKDDGKRLKYRVCLLPFKGKNDNITHIIVGFSWIEC